jgi:predicted  nucleic acid-binding Zn-ribbon protein
VFIFPSLALCAVLHEDMKRSKGELSCLVLKWPKKETFLASALEMDIFLQATTNAADIIAHIKDNIKVNEFADLCPLLTALARCAAAVTEPMEVCTHVVGGPTNAHTAQPTATSDGILHRKAAYLEALAQLCHREGKIANMFALSAGTREWACVGRTLVRALTSWLVCIHRNQQAGSDEEGYADMTSVTSPILESTRAILGALIAHVPPFTVTILANMFAKEGFFEELAHMQESCKALKSQLDEVALVAVELVIKVSSPAVAKCIYTCQQLGRFIFGSLCIKKQQELEQDEKGCNQLAASVVGALRSLLLHASSIVVAGTSQMLAEVTVIICNVLGRIANSRSGSVSRQVAAAEWGNMCNTIYELVRMLDSCQGKEPLLLPRLLVCSEDLVNRVILRVSRAVFVMHTSILVAAAGGPEDMTPLLAAVARWIEYKHQQAVQLKEQYDSLVQFATPDTDDVVRISIKKQHDMSSFIRHKLIDMKAGFMEQVDMLSAEVNNANERLSSKRSILEGIQTSIRSLTSKVQEEQAKAQSLEAQAAAGETRARTLEAKRAELDTRINNVQRDIHRKAAHYEDVQKQRSALKTKHEATIREHEATIQEHEATLKEQEATIREHEATLKEHEATLKEHEATLKEHEATLKEREATIREHEATLKEREATIREHEATLKDREATIREHEATLKDQEATIREHEATLKEREATLKEQEATLKEQEATIREHEATIREHEATIRERDLEAATAKIGAAPPPSTKAASLDDPKEEESIHALCHATHPSTTHPSTTHPSTTHPSTRKKTHAPKKTHSNMRPRTHNISVSSIECQTDIPCNTTTNTTFLMDHGAAALHQGQLFALELVELAKHLQHVRCLTYNVEGIVASHLQAVHRSCERLQPWSPPPPLPPISLSSSSSHSSSCSPF